LKIKHCESPTIYSDGGEKERRKNRRNKINESFETQ